MERDRQKNREISKKLEQQKQDIFEARNYDQLQKKQDFQKKLREIQKI